MKKIFKLLAIIVGLSACDENNVDNWTPDSLSIEVSNTEVIPREVGDGNWGVYVKPEFQGVFDIQINTDSPWQAIVEYITDEEEDWLELSEKEGNGPTALKLTVDANKSVVYRKAFLTVRTLASVPVDKKLTVIQTDSDPIIEFEPEDGSITYDIDSKTLSVDYVGNTYKIAFWSNIENYVLNVVPKDEAHQEKKVDWIKDFRVEDGVILFNTVNNLTGEARSANIVFEASDESFRDEYTLTQGKSLYKNVLKRVDDITDEKEYNQKEYSIARHIVKLQFESDEELSANITDAVSDEIVQWARAEVNGSEVTVNIDVNQNDEPRKATLSVRAKNPTFESQPAVTWSFTQKPDNLSADWKYLYENKMVFGPATKPVSDNPIVIATIETTDDEVNVSSTVNWVSATLEENRVLLQMEENSTGIKRNATLRLQNKNGKKTQIIEVEQRAVEKINEKENWNIEGGEYTDEYKNDKITSIIDNNTDTKWQWNWGSGEKKSQFPNKPYEFIVDFGSPQLFNSVKVWQVQALGTTNGYVKDIQFKISPDKRTWTDCGTYNLGANKNIIQSEIKTGDGSHFIQLPDIYMAQYVRIMILSNFWGLDGDVNNSKNAYLAEFNAYLK